MFLTVISSVFLFSLQMTVLDESMYSPGTPYSGSIIILYLFSEITLKRVIADGAYDNNENFQYLSDKNIEAAIKVRKNSSYDRSIGCYPRKRDVLKQF